MCYFEADLMLCFKIMQGFVNVDASEFFECVPLDFITCGHCNKLVYPNVRINVRQHVFAVRFEIFFCQMLLRLSQFLILKHVLLKKILQNL